MAEIEILNANNEFVDITPLLAKDGLEFSLDPIEEEIQTMDGTKHYGRKAKKHNITCRFRLMTEQEFHELAVLVDPTLITIRVTNPYIGGKTILATHVKKIPGVMRKRTMSGVGWFGNINILFEEP